MPVGLLRRYTPNLTEAQRATLKETVLATKDAQWAFRALYYIHDLSEARRSALQIARAA
jgi:hypothetical protein